MEGRRGSRFGLDSLHRVSFAADTSEPPSFESVIRNISCERPLSSAADEAERAARHLHTFSADQVVTIWEKGSYLMDVSTPPDAQKSGSRLLEAVCGRQDISTSTRRAIHAWIARPSPPELIPTRLKSLVELTDHGRKVDFSDESVIPTVRPWILPYYDTVASARSKNKKLGRSFNSSTSEEMVFGDIFQLIVDLLTLQRQPPSSADVESLLECLFTVCKTTHVTGDIKNSLAIFDAVISISAVPSSSFSFLLDVLCSIHASIKSLAGPTSRVVRDLAKSKSQQEMIELLHSFLLETPATTDRTLNVTRGAVDIFRDLVAAYGQEGMPTFSFDRLVSSLLQATTKDDGRIDTDILEVCLNMVQGDYLNVATQHTWSNLVQVILSASKRVIDPPPPPEEPAPASKSNSTEDVKSNISAHIARIAKSIEVAWPKLEEHHKLDCLHLFMKAHMFLSPTQLELALQLLSDQKSCDIGSANWIPTSWELLNNFILCRAKPAESRIQALDILRKAYHMDGAPSTFISKGFIEALSNDIQNEGNLAFLEKLIDFFVTVALGSDDRMFTNLVSALSLPIKADEIKEDSSPTSASSNPRSPSPSFANVLVRSLSGVCSTGLVRIFLGALVDHPSTKIPLVFEKLIEIAREPQRPSDARLTALKLLFAIRCDSAGAIYALQIVDSGFLLATLSRTIEITPRTSLHEDSSSERKGRSDNASGRLSLKDFISGPLPSPAHWLGENTIKWTSPVWTGAEDRKLPAEPPANPSDYVFAYPISTTGDQDEEQSRTLLPVNFWVEAVVALLQREKNWDVYSYVLVHLGPQFMNRELFRGAILQIKLLRSVLSEQIKNESFQAPLGPATVKKGDIAVCIFAALTSLISFHQHFGKSEQDETVRTFMLGIGSWEATARGCLHALSVCCHEIPLSVTRSLHAILDKVSKVITRTHISVHILEFLALLARLPDVFVNLRDEEIRTIFGICLRYIETSREQRYRAMDPVSSRSSSLPVRPSAMLKETYSASSAVTVTAEPKNFDDLSRYVYHLTYHVMVFWFLSLKLQDRSSHISWIAKRLVFTDEAGKEVIEEQSQVFLDFMQRVAFSDLGDTVPFDKFPPSESDGPVTKKTWIIGMSIVTVETAGASGLSQVTKRQASGTTYAVYQQRTAPILPHQIPVSPSPYAQPNEPTTRMLPSHILIQLTTSAFPIPMVMQPLPIPDDDFTRRAISTFDRNDIVDGHKVGVIYIGDGQTEEAEILANTSGSEDYEFFLSGLGTKVPLKDAKFNTQGLHYGEAGEYTYAWRDRVSEIVYHVVTMMPTDLETDPHNVKKKMHIGNDFVNIIFNRSNTDFAPDTILTQFNFVNIVISPVCRISPQEEPISTIESFHQTFYLVKVVSKTGFPELSSAANAKIISGRNLASFVRLMALNASAFSLVSSRGGEHVSSWQNRLREIRRLRDRAYAASAASSDTPTENTYYPPRRHTKAAASQSEEPATGQGLRANFGTEQSPYTETNIYQNLDFSRWSSGNRS